MHVGMRFVWPALLALQTDRVQALMFWAAATAGFVDAGAKLKSFANPEWSKLPDFSLMTLQKTIDARPDMVARFVRATAEGWKSFLADPAPAAAIMKRDNPNMTDGEIAFAVQKLKEGGSITGGDAAKLGIGIMTEARWKRTFDFMVEYGLIAPTVDWHKAYTTRFVDDLKVMP